MDADHDRSSDDDAQPEAAWPEPVGSEPVGSEPVGSEPVGSEPVGPDPEALIALPEEIPAGAPLRFLLREFHEDLGPTLYLWGVQVPGGAIGFSPDGKPIIEAESAENIRRLFGRVKSLDLIWIDPPDRA